MKATFVASATSPNQLVSHAFKEIAVVGRSNVGKSSLLKNVFGSSAEVRTSKKPGATRKINLFYVDNQIALVDLPGYGYAKMSKQEKRQIQSMLENYLFGRDNLWGVVLIVDARRDPVSLEDKEVLRVLIANNLQVLLVVNKIDLVSKNQQLKLIGNIERQLAIPQGTALAYSSRTGVGRAELIKYLKECV